MQKKVLQNLHFWSALLAVQKYVFERIQSQETPQVKIAPRRKFDSSEHFWYFLFLFSILV